jgi:hypothetical protein
VVIEIKNLPGRLCSRQAMGERKPASWKVVQQSCPGSSTGSQGVGKQEGGDPEDLRRPGGFQVLEGE